MIAGLSGLNKITFSEIMRREDVRSKFAQGYLPELIDIDDDFLLDSLIPVYEPHGIKYIKFIMIDDEGNITEDSKEKYMKIIDKGYLIRLEINRPIRPESIVITYILDLEDVKIIPIYTSNQEGTNTSIDVIYGFDNTNLFITSSYLNPEDVGMASSSIHTRRTRLQEKTLEILQNNIKLFDIYVSHLLNVEDERV